MRTFQRERWPSFALSVDYGWDRQSLKQDYLNCLGHLAVNARTLRGVVERLLSLGVSRKELLEWAVCEGYDERSVRKLLSSLCLRAGQRLREPGAGPKTPPEALAILAFARDQFGDEGDNFLHAASRAAKKQAAIKRAQSQEPALSRSGIRTEAVPETTAPPSVQLPIALEGKDGPSEHVLKTGSFRDSGGETPPELAAPKAFGAALRTAGLW